MKTLFQTIFLTSALFTSSAFAATKFISQYSVDGSFNSSIESLLPGSVDCSNKLIKSKEFSARLNLTYGAEAAPILAKINSASFNFTFQPFYPAYPSTIASTNMNGLIRLNNKKNNKTLSSLTATVSHEGVHNLGYKHDDNIFPDVAYTVGNIIGELVEQGFCEGKPESQVRQPEINIPSPTPVKYPIQSSGPRKLPKLKKFRSVLKQLKKSFRL